jgi:hypothetical protein
LQRLQFESLVVECLEDRRLLSAMYWDGASNSSFLSANWYEGAPGNLPLVAWSDLDASRNRNDAYIPETLSTTNITMSSVDEVSPGAIYFYPDTGNAGCVISGGTVALTANTVIGVQGSGNAEIDSAIAGSGSTLTKQYPGTLDLTNSANSIQSIVIQAGTLEANSDGALGGAANITFDGLGGSATLQAAGRRNDGDF